MTQAQKELLYKIADLHSGQFYLNMKDNWSDNDYSQDKQYTKEILTAENEYIQTYGPLPVWDSIDDVFQAKKELKAELGL